MNSEVIRETFRELLMEAENEVYAVNQSNGWFDDSRTVGDDIALLHSEVSEAFEAYRDWGLGDMTDEKCKYQSDGEPAHSESKLLGMHLCKPEGFGSELADILVRLLDTSRRHGIDLGHEFWRKLDYNRTRGHKHGGKRV